jgi:SAM-dependent methyltransferase
MSETQKALIKIDLDEVLRSASPMVVELGCGPKKQAGRIGVDLVELPGVDIVADIEFGLHFLPDACVDEIHAHSIFEHIRNFEQLMREMLRVLKPGGKVFCFVPHFSNPYYFSDYTHIRFFGYYTFFYFCEFDQQPERKVPIFYTDIRIDVESVDLVFTSPFRSRSWFKRLAQRIFNRSRWWQEFYEENLCFLVPCYGIKTVFKRITPPQ